MPSPLRDPKSLPEWIELDYYRRPRKLRRVRWWLGWGVFFVCVLIVVGLTFGLGNHRMYQAGPVSPAHAMFNDDCAQCHTQQFQPVRRLFGFGGSEVRSVTNDACLKCHEGPIHHAQQLSEPSCATCHREHQGTHLLSRIADNHCTNCHADLKRKDGQTPQFHTTITAFAVDHPPFGKHRGKELDDPTTLRFNHDLHLKLNMKELAGRGIQGLDPNQEKLDCSSCHEPDAARRYLKPMNYERHCAHCHALGVQIAGDFKDEQTKAAVEAFRKEPAPHEEPRFVRAALRDRLTQFALSHKLDAADAGEVPRPIPGRRPSTAVTKEQWEWVNKQLDSVERPLFTGGQACRKCHGETGRTPEGLPQYAASGIQPPTGEDVRRWFPHSIFSHNSHRMLSCSECHDAAGSSKTADLLMPKIDACLKCHTPQAGVRSDCVTCHGYHDPHQKRVFRGQLRIGDLSHGR